jgi:hypothetical protein
MTEGKTKIATLLSTSELVVLDAACPLYVLGGSGERRKRRGRDRQASGILRNSGLIPYCVFPLRQLA